MEKLIKYNTALLAREKGFDKMKMFNVFYDKDDNISLGEYTLDGETPNFPTQSSLQTWLRKKHDLHIYVTHKEFGVSSEDGYYYHIGKSGSNHYFGPFKKYEKALEEGLQETLKLIK